MKASLGLPRAGLTKQSGQRYSAGNWFPPVPDTKAVEALKARLEESRSHRVRTVKTHSEARALTDMGWRVQAYGSDYVLLTMRA